MKSKIKIERIMYPKTFKTTAGEYSIFTARVIEHLEGEEPIVHPMYGTLSLKGIVPSMESGDEFIATYGEPEESKFGVGYKLSCLSKEINRLDIKQVEEYLKFIAGEKIAKELMLLDNPLDLIENRNDEVLLKVKGIGAKKLELIYKNASTSMDFSVAYASLIPLGLSHKLITNICQSLGSAQTAIELCKTNPYGLVRKVKGVSFVKADEIARKCGLDMNSTERIECAIYHILFENGANGKSYLTSTQLMEELSRLNLIDWTRVNEVVMQMAQQGQIVLINNGTQISLKYYFELERNIAKEIYRLMNAETHIDIPKNWQEVVKEIESAQGWEHTDEQWDGIETVLNNNVVLITGYGGTGKSTVTNAMTTILNGYMISQTCLSAKASQRLEEVTGRESKTIHRLLGIGYKKDEDDDEGVQHNENLYTDIVILDEFSMVNGTLFLKLLKALPNGTKLVLLGDTGQLQAIGDCCCMSDMLVSSKIPTVNLTKIHRQAEKSAIITKSIDVRLQKALYEKGFRGHQILGELQDLELFIDDNKENLMSMIVRKFKEEMERFNENILEVQIISPTKQRGEVSTQKINTVIQSIYNPKLGNSYTNSENGFNIYKGDKVINTRNNYNAVTAEGDKTSIFNGNIGIVTNITANAIYVDFLGTVIEFTGKDRDALNLAYAITTHSSQGSQWESIICAFDMGGYTLLNVEMLYTAITRASKHCSVVAEHNAIQTCLRNVEQRTKQTYLSNFLFTI